MDEKLKTEVQELGNRLWAQLLQNYPRVREAYTNDYGLPELDPLRYEVCICLAVGLNQAAIALTNHLLESMLKYGLIYSHSLKQREKQPKADGPVVDQLIESWSEGRKLYDTKDLNYTINRACSVGLITKEEKKMLHEYRKKLRNAYSHADKGKTFGDFRTSVVGMRLEGTEFIADAPSEVRLAEMLVGQGLFQARIAKDIAAPYFLSIDKIARQIIGKVFPQTDSGKSS